ncbi:MAG: oxidoreductase [Thalassobius sp.]|nr:oxidoreductase [Thalassovita sp.]
MKKDRKEFVRRDFLKSSAIAGTGMALGLSAFPNIVKSYNQDIVRIGVVGTGGRGNWLIKQTQSSPDIKIVACCDLIPERLETGMSLADEKAKSYSDYRKLIEDKSIDALIIATPLSVHYEVAMAALDAGKHVFCEKTMTHNIEQTVNLSHKVKNSNLVFQMGFQQRMSPLFHRINEIISGGYIGDIQHIYASWNRNGDWRRAVKDPKMEKLINWRLYREYSGGLMAELCAHQIDVVNWMLDSKPVKVVGSGGVNYWKDGRETYDNVHTIFDYPNGTKATFTSLTTNSYEAFSVKFYGTKATLEIHRRDGQRAVIYPEPIQGANDSVDGVSSATKKVLEAGEGIPVVAEFESEDDAIPTSRSLADFAKCIIENKKPQADIVSGHNTAIAVHMGNQAMREQKTMEWGDKYDL